MVHLYFNVIGSVVFLVLFYTLDAVFHFSVMEEPVDRVRIALVHTGFNLAATAFMLPLSKWLEKLAVWTIPDSAAEPEQVQLLDSRLFGDAGCGSGPELFHNCGYGRPGPPGREFGDRSDAQVG